MTALRNRPLVLALLTALVVALGWTAVGAGAGSATSEGARTLTVDIAENGRRFFFDEAPVFPDGMPAAGNPFVTEGYVYPAGTLEDGDGVLPGGGPQWPRKVIGTWFCRGYFIADGSRTTEGSLAFTTQLISLGSQPHMGRQTVVITGLEGAEVGEPVTGAVTGGTGRWSTVRGEAVQRMLGFNNDTLPTAGMNKRIVLHLAR